MVREQTTEFLYETTTKIKKPIHSFSDLKKYKALGKVSESAITYLHRKYYKGLTL